MNKILPLQNLISRSLSEFSERLFLLNAEESKTSYEELRLKANSIIESYLGSILHGNLVGIYSDKNVDACVFVYSILLAGKAYLPLDYRSPVDRIVRILKSAEPAAVLVQQKYLDVFVKFIEHEKMVFRQVNINRDYSIIVFERAKVYRSDLAYILFTSGSTGVPKGIMHTHDSAIAFLDWCKNTFEITDGSKFISIAPFQFDLSVFDLFYPLTCGGSILLPSDADLSNSRMMGELLESFTVEVIYTTPSFLNWLLSTGRPERRNFKKIKHTLIAGEVLRWSLLQDLKNHFTESSFYNLYGPTETNVCTFYKVNFGDEKKYNASVPIGKACSSCKTLLKDGSNGTELFIAGANLMTGYVGVEDTIFQSINGVNYYNTGDVVIQSFDENLCYISRADRMIKKNGYRIEPAEVETCLKTLQGVKNAVVVDRKYEDGTQLLAFIVSETEYDMLSMRNHCAAKIPAYMIPDSFIFTDTIPLNANHKTDTQTLLKLVQ